mmetsp:Transcript_62808/g.147317  ORF Transcript_62808/g.147317 Transcript_62808/m.147317 type:complete len:125 (+) Transcript_62808:912-1286(+)
MSRTMRTTRICERKPSGKLNVPEAVHNAYVSGNKEERKASKDKMQMNVKQFGSAGARMGDTPGWCMNISMAGRKISTGEIRQDGWHRGAVDSKQLLEVQVQKQLHGGAYSARKATRSTWPSNKL